MPCGPALPSSVRSHSVDSTRKSRDGPGHRRFKASQSRHDFVDALTHVNETPLTIAAILTYGIGRLGRWPTVTDIGIHATEAMVLTDVTSELIRGPIGRARPRISPDDAFKFEFGKGFTDFGNRAFPSLHSAAAFAMASVLTAEIHERNPKAAWIAGPVLYGAALIPGMTRIYLDQHWASDIARGRSLERCSARRSFTTRTRIASRSSIVFSWAGWWSHR